MARHRPIPIQPAPSPSEAEPPDLSAWTRRTTIEQPRLTELVELYEELGFDVLLRPVSPAELGDECVECYLAEPGRYRTIYTRPRGDG